CSAQPAPPKGDASRSSRNVGAGCDGRCGVSAVQTVRTKTPSVRRSRVVLAPRPWRQAAGKSHAATVAKTAASPRRARISRKAIARGKPGCPGCTCGLTRVHFCLPVAHGTTGAVGARLSLRPLFEEGQRDCNNPGKTVPRERERMSHLSCPG